MGGRLDIALLGPLQLRVDGQEVALAGAPQRAVLARLALSPDRPVAASELVDVLWTDDPPANAAGNLQSYLSRLRRVVGKEVVVLEPAGYRLRVQADHVDVGRVERLAAEAGAIARADPLRSAALLGRALAAWRGEPLADLTDVLAFAPERARLSALRRRLQRELVALRLTAGGAAAVLPDIEAAATAEPHDEEIQLLLVRALHHLGRTAEALRIADAFRRRLVDDAGLDPSPALADLEQRLLAHDPALRPRHHARANGEADRRDRSDPLGASASWPRFTTRLHGRERELHQVDALLRGERVVTLAGAGGVGKTRLAVEMADRLAAAGRPVAFLPLVSVLGADPLDDALAGALGLRVGPGQHPLDAIRERLGTGGHVLVLDNCEHVADRARDLVDGLLTARSDLVILTTSRVPLGLAAECVVRIGSLDGSRTGGDPGDQPALRLFTERAQRVRPGWEPDASDLAAIAGIVGRLGGIPLAIELAAGRLSSLSLGDLAARIGDAIDLLADGRPSATARHRSLRATLDWSYRLLAPDEQRLLRHLSAFPDGADLAAVELVGSALGLPGGGTAELAALVDASMVDADLDGTARYSMLEPVRAFAEEEQASAGEQQPARALLATWARETAEAIDRLGRGPDELAADRRLRRELRNLRAAHRLARTAGDLDTAITISASLGGTAVRDVPEVWSWALELGSDPRLAGHPRRTEALGAAAEAAWLKGDLDLAERLAGEALALDPASVRPRDALASVLLFRGEPARAQELWTTIGQDDPSFLGRAGLAAVYAGDVASAHELLERGRRWATTYGSPTDLANCHYAMAELLSPAAEAVQHYQRAIELARGVGSTFVEGVATVGLASVHAATGRAGEALAEYDRLVRHWQRTGNWTQQWTTLRNLAVLLADLGDGATADLLLHAAARAREAAAVRTGRPALPVSPADRPPGDDPEAPTAGEVVAAALDAIGRALRIVDG